MVCLFWISICGIFWSMIGYPIFLKIISRFIKRKNKKDFSYKPTVTIMVVAHNEEKVILEKLNNIVNIDYPKNKIKFLIASDNSTDKTDKIVEDFIHLHPEYDIRLHKTIAHKGKTNAQNEAQKLVDTEILVMTDANALLNRNSINELVASFSEPNIVYVTGKLEYRNVGVSSSSLNEGNYWNLDLMMREIESNIQTITAGNGAIYACRNAEYHDFSPIECHDASMPLYYGLRGKRAIFNKDAIAVEKAGETTKDEFKRKIRMNRRILHGMIPCVEIFNIFKYKWLSVFYFGHRTCRYSLWLFHIMTFITNVFLAFKSKILFYKGTCIIQCVFWMVSLMGNIKKRKNKVESICGYYGMALVAQIIGIVKILFGKVKPTWEKAESTR